MYTLLPEERRISNRKMLDILRNTSKIGSAEHSLALLNMPVTSIIIQDGPYCNKTCAHCSGDFGPTKTKAPMRLYEELMKQITDTDISEIIITDGEPFHDIDRLENIIKLLDGMPVELNTNGEFAKTVKDAEIVFARLRSAGLTFEKKNQRSITGTANSTIAVSADKYHGEASFGYALHVMEAFHNVFKELSVKDSLGVYHDTKYHVAISGLFNPESYFFSKFFPKARVEYFAQRRSLAELDKKIIRPLKKVISHNSYKHLRSDIGMFVTDNMAAYVLSRSIVPYGRAKKMFSDVPEAEKIFDPKDAHSPFPSAPTLYLTSSGNVYDVPSFHCIMPGRYIGNIFEESLKGIIDRTNNNVLHRMERERGIKGIYKHLYKAGMKIKANDHCELCKTIFADLEFVEEYNRKFFDSWRDYEHRLVDRCSVDNHKTH